MTAAVGGPVGRVVRLQVQRSPLKPGIAPDRWYDPTPVTSVPQLRVDATGAVGIDNDGREVPDVHHPDHPLTRNRRGRNAISLLTTTDHDRLRDRFGAHLVAGIAGESVLIESPRPAADLLGFDLEIAGDDAVIRLTRLRAAPPCVEFTRFCLGRDATDTGAEVLATLAWLGDGRRGLYAVSTVVGAMSCFVRVGAHVTATCGAT